MGKVSGWSNTSNAIHEYFWWTQALSLELRFLLLLISSSNGCTPRLTLLLFSFCLVCESSSTVCHAFILLSSVRRQRTRHTMNSCRYGVCNRRSPSFAFTFCSTCNFCRCVHYSFVHITQDWRSHCKNIRACRWTLRISYLAHLQSV